MVIQMDNRNMECTPEFKILSNRSMMCFTFRDGSHLIGYQLEMLKNNRIPSLLKPEILKVDQEIRISFDITSMIPLKKILERKEIGRGEFIQYLRQITGIFDQLENHLLDYGGLLLDSSLIYGSPSDNRIYFAYIPQREMEQDINESLRTFIIDLIIKEMKFRNEQADNYIQRLIEALKDPDFGLETLKTWLDAFSRGQKEKQPLLPASQPSAEPRTPAPPEQAAPGSGMKPVQPEKPDNRMKQHKTVTQKKRVYPLRSWLILGSAVAAILALVFVMIMKGSFEPDNPDMLTTLIGLALISGAVLYLICSKVFAPDKKVERVVEKKILVPGNRTNARVISAVPDEHVPRKVEYVNKAISQPANQEPQYERPRAIAEAAIASDRTVILAHNDQAVPGFRRLGGNEETVMIKQWPYRIGRMEGQVDYCIQNPAIGRVHAELSKGPQGYCITDMNTRNGTFINGKRIEPNKEQPIKSGDRFMLANEEFHFFA